MQPDSEPDHVVDAGIGFDTSELQGVIDFSVFWNAMIRFSARQFE